MSRFQIEDVATIQPYSAGGIYACFKPEANGISSIHSLSRSLDDTHKIGERVRRGLLSLNHRNDSCPRQFRVGIFGETGHGKTEIVRQIVGDFNDMAAGDGTFEFQGRRFSYGQTEDLGMVIWGDAEAERMRRRSTSLRGQHEKVREVFKRHVDGISENTIFWEHAQTCKHTNVDVEEAFDLGVFSERFKGDNVLITLAVSYKSPLIEKFENLRETLSGFRSPVAACLDDGHYRASHVRAHKPLPAGLM